MTSAQAEPYEETPAFKTELAAIADAMHAGRKTSRPDPRVLRDAVRVCAVHARLNQCPPERLIRALKALVREIALEDPSDAYRVVHTDRVIAWAIEGYYEFSGR